MNLYIYFLIYCLRPSVSKDNGEFRLDILYIKYTVYLLFCVGMQAVEETVV